LIKFILFVGMTRVAGVKHLSASVYVCVWLSTQ